MCLTKAGELKTAEKDIFCWKQLRNGNKAKYRNFVYKIGQEQLEIDIKKNFWGEVNEGYHSWRLFSIFSMELFVIPKGSRYYKGNENEDRLGYTSSKIVYLGHIFSPKTWWRVLTFKTKKK